MTEATPPPDDPAWAAIRARYEAGEEAVKAIAAAVGLTAHGLVAKAKALGWRLRKKAKATARGEPAAKAKPESTAATIRRLKDVLQARLAQLETQLQDIGADVSALGTERDIRATNTLVRTLEKVLDLERKDRTRRKTAKQAFKHFDDAQRDALARKIEGLEGAWDGGEAGPQPGQPRGDGT